MNYEDTKSLPSYNTILLKKEWPYSSKDRDTLCHFGGDPLLPTDWSWPVHQATRPEEKEYPMHFLAQIDCKELPSVKGRELLPENGILYFFVFNEERLGQEDWWGDPPACCVMHYNGPISDLSRRSPPDDIMRLYEVYRKGRYDKSFANEIQTDDYMKRHGFVPISFHPITTTRDPRSCYPEDALKNIDREEWLSEREALIDKILGPVDQPDYQSVLDDPHWPETVFQARLYLKLEQINWLKRVEASQITLENLRDGKPIYSSLALPEPKSDEERDRIRKRHMKSLPEIQAKVDTAEEILNTLSDMKLHEAPSDTIRSKIRSLRSEFDDELHHGHITNHLLRIYAMDEVPVSPTSISLARQTRQQSNCNENQFLGYPRELHDGSPVSALRGLKSLGWADKDATENNISLLAQFDTCGGGIDISWGDAGMLYFYGLTKDFENRNYENVIVILEGC